ncbi:uncharacterized protein LOC114256328 isoform X3 [Camellia sinensis]|uniref:uncharacterized protein LOC114256328 isoform X3 n=1 Tax=Camellia sinensis TaxID=4442 RepID=UPI001035ECFD|nr:uncharacterized protein LOC114256328 isoform X3 [Camellia sinensis]
MCMEQLLVLVCGSRDCCMASLFPGLNGFLFVCLSQSNLCFGSKMALRLNEGDEVEIEPDPATWTALEEELYIQLMVKEVHKGNRSSTTFSRKGWKQIEQEFCEKTNKRYNNSQFRNKFNQLRTRFNDFSKLLKEPGFTWEPVLSTVTATDAVWESYIKIGFR